MIRRENLSTILVVSTICVLTFMYIYFRMQCVEKDYTLNKLRKEINEKSLTNKELKAKKASLLSVKSLRSYAQKYKLNVPSRDQIIVIDD